MKLEKFETNIEGFKSYGFIVYNRSGYSLPKGMITSMRVEQYDNMSVSVDFSVQSPSGDSPDSSDHLSYNMPVIKSFYLGKQVVDIYAEMIDCWITAQSKSDSIQ
jgi:hypothetical protein